MSTPADTARTALLALRRPRLLIRAARFALGDYERGRGLARVFGAEGPNTSDTDVLAPLIAREAAFEHCRREGHVTYSVTRHIDVLVALMAEARRLIAEGDAA
jgi:hypothetical protein